MYVPRDQPVAGEASDEAYRLKVLATLELLDTPPEAEFDALVQIAQHIMQCPISLVSLVDDQRQWFKARCGLDASETDRDLAFCSHAIASDDIMVVPDATLDPRFRANALVTGAPHIRFYAGVPLRVSLDGVAPAAALGTLCVIDSRPRTLSDQEATMLRHLARLAESLIRGRMHIGQALRYAEERRVAAQRIDRKNRQLWQAERMAQIGSWRFTIADKSLEWSNQVFVIHGLPFGVVPSLEEATHFYPPGARETIVAAMQHTIDSGQPLDIETDFVTATGASKRIHAMAEVEIDGGQVVALVGVFQDITGRFEMEQTLRRLANQDALTGIANRAGFHAALDDGIAAARREGGALGLILIDLDHFKQVNDLHGHKAGDEVLQGIARRLQAPYLNQCIPARLGGDEFALIVTCADDCRGIDMIAQRLLGALRRPIDVSEGTMAVAGTVGIAWLEDGLSRTELVHRADMALYEAKRAGKGVSRTWSSGAGVSGLVETDRRKGSRRR